MVGCGLQAHAHLAAFTALCPTLTHVKAFSRSRSSSEKLCAAAHQRGLTADVSDRVDDLLAMSDIVISMVPAAADLRSFLDARRLRPDAFVAAIDIGRSWLPDSLFALDLLVTDSLAQSKTPYDEADSPLTAPTFATDLVALCAATSPPSPGRSMFCFRGNALGDLALAGLALQEAKRLNQVCRLPR
jgi:ornithine cyclodeaminase/alanine dehydrogenase-like protein (mu-crystallin family)